MKVRLTTSRVLANGQTQDFGMEIELDPSEAVRMFAEGQAERIDGQETAMIRPGENAMRPSGKPNRTGEKR